MKALYKIALLVCISAVFTSCFDKSRPNYQYFPNMYEAVPYETYSEVPAFPNGKEGQLPAKGSIPRGLNSMGSHANQLSQEERWQVAHYVMKLKSEL